MATKRVSSPWNPKIDCDITGEPDSHTVTRKEYYELVAERDKLNKTGQLVRRRSIRNGT